MNDPVAWGERWDRGLAAVIDHTMLRADVTEAEVVAACAAAERYRFAALVVSPYYLPLAVRRLSRTPVKACSVVAFPFGDHDPYEKATAARRLVRAGAGEIDAVMNISAFLSGSHETVVDEVRRIADVCDAGGASFKLIIETAYLNSEQIKRATEIGIQNGAHWIKTSTGCASRGVTVEDIETIKGVAGERAGIKASGGIRTAAFARELLEAGATRLGCSASIEIIRTGA